MSFHPRPATLQPQENPLKRNAVLGVFEILMLQRQVLLVICMTMMVLNLLFLLLLLARLGSSQQLAYTPTSSLGALSAHLLVHTYTYIYTYMHMFVSNCIVANSTNCITHTPSYLIINNIMSVEFLLLLLLTTDTKSAASCSCSCSCPCLFMGAVIMFVRNCFRGCGTVFLSAITSPCSPRRGGDHDEHAC